MNLYFQRTRTFRHNGECLLDSKSLFSEPRCSSFAAIGAVISAAGVAYGAYNASTMPGPPNLANASREASNAQANALAPQRQLSAAAEQGTSALQAGYRTRDLTPEQASKARASAQATLNKLRSPDHVWPAGTNSAQQIALWQARLDGIPQGGGTVYFNNKGQLASPTEAVANFEGFGTADVQGKLAQQMADIQKELGDKYGVQFADEARSELEQSDPEGFAAREKENELIQQQINRQPDRPVADLLDRQVSQQLSAGNKLDPMERDILDQAVGEAQSARGQSGVSNDAFAAPMETGAEGEARRQAGIQKALGWETSGGTPEDVEYRRREQNMSDLGALINGQSPVTQFQNLSGAQQGTTPFVPGQAQPMMSNPNVGAAGGFALGNWETQMKQANNTANPWLTGLTALLKGTNALSLVQPGGG